MKFEWNPQKNEWLKRERKISFEDIVFHLSQGDVWRISDHPKRSTMIYDDEELEILDALEKDRLPLGVPSKSEIAAIKAAALNTFKKDKQVTIRLYDHDYKAIQKKAMELGVPYQTLISGLIHSYIEGDLKLEPAKERK